MRLKQLLGVGAWAGLWGAVPALVGQDPEPLNAPAPLATAAAAAPLSAGALAELRVAADRALELGFSSVAADLYRQLLAAGPEAFTPGERANLGLLLATSLLEGGRAEDAQKALAGLPEPRSSAWHLRAGLAAMQLRNYEAARAARDAIKEPELPVADYAWYWFLQGALVDVISPAEQSRANDFYKRAENAAPNELALARFQLAAEEVRLRFNLTKAEDLKTQRDNYDRFQGRPIGYKSAVIYAMSLDALGRNSEALTFLQIVLATLPVQERQYWDDMRLVAGVLGQRGRGVLGRKALTELLAAGHEPNRQRQALQLLWEASPQEPARSQLRNELDRLLGLPSHPIRESLLFYRAQLALAERNEAKVQESATALIEQFPGSALRAHAFGLLTQMAWEQRRYRLAADSARKARGALADLKSPRELAARATLGVVEAEAWYRAGAKDEDRNAFRNAADAYAAALGERPPDVKPGDLIFQRVLSEIKAGATAEAAKVLDQLAADPVFDLENRWQAEWSLARALQAQGKDDEAYGRVTLLLDLREAAAVRPEWRARMAWLQARLSRPEDVPRRVEALLGSLGGIDEVLRTEIASSAILMQAGAEFRLKREAEALRSLARVRAEYPRTDAARTSYLEESAHYAATDQIQKAKAPLIELAENPNYRNSADVPWALYYLAQLSERLGQEKDLKEAIYRIEDLVNTAAASAQPDLVFKARMKQGELLRRLNQFPQAQQVYEDLKNRPASPENSIMARLELAKVQSALAATDPTLAEKAQLLFEELRDRVDASDDVRVEAGYHLGVLLAARGRADRALKAWWADVITPFLLEPKSPPEEGALRRYWLARTLLNYGALLEQQDRRDEARSAYELVLRKGLGTGEGEAAKALARLGARA